MRIVSVCSARPNFVKLAAVHHAIAAVGEGVEHVIVHTGQHYDPLFSDVFFEQLQIPAPQYNLGVHGGTRDEVITRTQEAFAQILPLLKPDVVLVYGDVNGAVGAAQAAKAAGIKIAHVEAGLRSFDLSMPEEHNRIAIDQIADLLLCSEQSGLDNLQREGVEGFLHLVGNTMIDTLIRMMPFIKSESLPIALAGPFAVATLHRPSNVDSPEDLKRNLEFLAEISAHCPVILPVHHRLKAAIEQFELHSCVPSGVHLLEPLGYIPFLRLVQDAAFILTDSGGIQEEATFLRKRCFTLRTNTERPSTIESGSNVLIDVKEPEQRALVLSFAQQPTASEIQVPALWDGEAGKRIVSVLMSGV